MINQLKKTDDKYMWLNDISSKALKDAIMTSDHTYRSFLKGKIRFPKFKSRKRTHRESYFFIKDNIKYMDNKNIIKLPLLKKVRISDNNSLPTLSSITSGRIIREYNKYYVMFNYETDKHKYSLNDMKYGIDLGVKTYATIYDGYKTFQMKHFKDMSLYQSYEERIIKLQQISSNKVEMNYAKLLHKYMDKHGEAPEEKYKNIMKGESYNSSRIRILFNKIRRLKKRKNNIKLDYIRKLCYLLTAKTKPYEIKIEELDVSDMLENDSSHTLHRHIQESNFYMFRMMLQHKCEEYGIKLKLVDKYYPSTKICCKCGMKNHVTLSDRIYKCNCGNTMDRDINASINIYHTTSNYYKDIA